MKTSLGFERLLKTDLSSFKITEIEKGIKILFVDNAAAGGMKTMKRKSYKLRKRGHFRVTLANLASHHSHVDGDRIVDFILSLQCLLFVLNR